MVQVECIGLTTVLLAAIVDPGLPSFQNPPTGKQFDLGS